MSLSKKNLGKKDCEDPLFLSAIKKYKEQGLSLAKVIQRIEKKYEVKGYYYAVLENLYNRS